MHDQRLSGHLAIAGSDVHAYDRANGDSDAARPDHHAARVHVHERRPILIDRVTDLYSGDTTSLPQQSPVVNYYLAATEQYHGAPIEQANFENVDVLGELAPEKGEQGGKIVAVIHSTIDNSPSLLNKIEARIAQALNIAAPTPYAAP